MRRQHDNSLRPICRIDWNVFRALSVVLIVILTLPGGRIVDGVVIATPVAKHVVALPGAAREDAVLVAIQRDGKIFLGAEPVKATDLAARFRPMIMRGAENRVYIIADMRAKYGAVEEVLNAVQASGIERVSFVTFMPRTIRNASF
jgi:biopolymer transport protein TolR